MSPGVVGTALAAVAAGSLVLFSLVLQQSAFDSSFTQGLAPLSPNDTGSSISVQAPPQEDNRAGDGTSVAENTAPDDGGASAPTSGSDTLGPIVEDGDDDGSLVASTEEPPENDDFPSASGDTDNSVNNSGSGPIVNADGPQVTISKDPNGGPDDVTLPDRNGPKNTATPHDRDEDGHRDDDSDDREDDRDDDSDDRDKDKSKSDDPQKSGDQDESSKSEDKSKSDDPQKSGDQDESSQGDKSKSEDEHPGTSRDDDLRTNPDRDNDDRDDDGGDRSPEGGEPEDRNDRHDTRRDPDDDDAPDDDDDDDDDREDSHHSDVGSQGHSRARGPKG
ncbi:MAG: hypothetical protein ACRDJT_08180 [Actinomycetota bacterium]